MQIFLFTPNNTSFKISRWALLALAASVRRALSSSSFLSLNRMISLSVSLPPLLSSTWVSGLKSLEVLIFCPEAHHSTIHLPMLLSSREKMLTSQHLYHHPLSHYHHHHQQCHLFRIIVSLLLPTVAFLQHILVPCDQSSQVTHRDVSAHLNFRFKL